MLHPPFRLSLCLLAVLVTAGLAPGAAAAPPPTVSAADPAAERLRLRAELDRVNAEIDALKRAGRDDSRLRARMADAEALARRLVDLERRMGLTAGGSEPRPLPTALPSDGPADLDAKADILTDQARRVRAAADVLDRRVAEVKGRQELRRRAADLDRDPFAPLEGSKRRTVSIASPEAPRPTLASSPPGGSSSAPGGSNSGPLTGTTSTPAVGPQGATGAPTGPVSNLSSGVSVVTPPLVLSVELRNLLDPATLTDIGQLEHGRAPTSLAALQRAVSSLRGRAADLDAQARAMRRAATRP